MKYVHRLDRFLRLDDSPNGGFLVHYNSESSLVVDMKSKQHLDQTLIELVSLLSSGIRISICL